MNYNQNHKISQITSKTLIVGIDVAKHKHVARAQDDRGYEFGKRLFFDNSISGFEQMIHWIEGLMKAHDKDQVMIGAEPTGHYWMNLAYYLKAKNVPFVLVNPMHVKKSKELDDNSPTKNDTKDARVIAQLIKDGRYSVPNLLEGLYAEMREGIKIRDQLLKDESRIKGRIHNWLDRYFPEFTSVFKDWEGKTALYTLSHFPFPSDILRMTDEEIVFKWKEEIRRGVGMKRAKSLRKAAQCSVGITEGTNLARMEIQCLLRQYELLQEELNRIEAEIETLLKDIPGAKEMLSVPGLGSFTLATFFAEVGDLRQYSHPKQIQKHAGLSLKEHSSGKYKGQTKISKRGRKRLRKALFLAVRPMVAHNPVFKALHAYYTKRPERPLKKMESLIALCCKLIRILFVMGTKQCSFDSEKMLNDMPHIAMLEAAA